MKELLFVLSLSMFVVTLFVGCAVAIGVDIPSALKTPSITDWMQGVATVIGVLIALFAYLQWGKQELAKAEAEQARQLLYLIPRYCLDILAVRGGRMPTRIISSDIAGLVLAKKEKLRLCSDRTQEVQLTSLTILDEQVADNVNEIVKIAQRVIGAWDSLSELSKKPVLETTDIEQARICLTDAGCYADEKGRSAPLFELIGLTQALKTKLRARLKFEN